MLKIAIQKSGRLYDDSVNLLRDAGFKIQNSLDQLKAQVSGLDAEVLFLRNSDIPGYLASGVADLAIIGHNVLIEKQVQVDSLIELGFSSCRLSLATPKAFKYESIEDLSGKKIATSYPVTLQQYLDAKGVSASIHKISGSVEIAPNIGLADAICDIVSSGSTLIKNGLKEQDIVLKSQAVLAANKTSLAEKREVIDNVLFRIKSVLAGRSNSYIMFNIPTKLIDDVVDILPGLKSPTILPLHDANWSSLHTVISEKQYWDVIPQLKELGAEGFLVIPIEKMIY